MGMKGAIFVLAIGVAVVYLSRYNRGNDEPVSLNATYDYIIRKISYGVINNTDTQRFSWNISIATIKIKQYCKCYFLKFKLQNYSFIPVKLFYCM